MLWIGIRMDVCVPPGSGSGIICSDPDSINKQKTEKSKKNFDLCSFMTCF